ncbi:hypothetical protein BJF84_24855 [Rhodococcus sp. CUA-806]|nr:hypothetical protein BJF84_24855 [Rhodococcus sp. CUA-806]
MNNSQMTQRLPTAALVGFLLRGLIVVSPLILAFLVFGIVQGHALISLIPGVLVGVVSVWRWFFTRWGISNETIQLHVGGLHRRRLSLTLANVSTVRVTSTVIHRTLGLRELRISGRGAGGDACAMRLVGVGSVDARMVEVAVAHATEGRRTSESTHEFQFENHWSAANIISIPGLALAIAIYFAVTELFGGTEAVQYIQLFISSIASFSGWLAAGVSLFVILVAFSILSSFCQNYNLRAEIGAGEFTSIRGLYAQREIAVAFADVVGLEIKSPSFFGFTFSRVDAIVSGIGGTKHGAETMVLPLVPTVRALDLVSRFSVPMVVVSMKLRRPDIRAYLAAVIGDILLATITVTVMSFVAMQLLPRFDLRYSALVSAVWAGMILVRRYLFRAEFCQGWAKIRSRIVWRNIDLIDLRRAELLEVRSEGVQRLFKVGSGRLFLPGGRYWYQTPVMPLARLDELVWEVARSGKDVGMHQLAEERTAEGREPTRRTVKVN